MKKKIFLICFLLINISNFVQAQYTYIIKRNYGFKFLKNKKNGLPMAVVYFTDNTFFPCEGDVWPKNRLEPNYKIIPVNCICWGDKIIKKPELTIIITAKEAKKLISHADSIAFSVKNNCISLKIENFEERIITIKDQLLFSYIYGLMRSKNLNISKFKDIDDDSQFKKIDHNTREKTSNKDTSQ